MTQLLSVENLSLRFEFADRNTLSDVTFNLQQGESLLVLGPSGCGKSTLTLCLNGLYPREFEGSMTGDILVNGKPTTSYEPGELSQAVGVVFQDPETQFCMLTVEDEVAFGLENLAVPHNEMEERIVSALRLVNMEEYRQSSISTLSGGQKQKLALACILALNPKLLILDEPTANLDPIARMDLIRTIKRIKNELGFSLIIIEHQLDQWTDLAERCLLLNKNGSVFYDGFLRQAIRELPTEIEKEGIWLPKVAQQLLPYIDSHSDQIPLTIEEFSREAHRWSGIPWRREVEKSSPATTEKLLDCRNVSLSIDGQDILKNISLTIRDNEFIAIVGANGSGKTTLSRLLTGLQRPSNGTISLHGKPLNSWREADLRKEVGYVFQNPEHQFITNTVFDEVAFSLQMKGMPKEEIQDRVDQLLETLGLTDYSEEHPYTLSQGQKRRLSIATMLVDEQKLMILDEPTFGQDAATNLEMMELLSDRYRNGTGMIMVTHDMDLVHTYAKRVIVINNGMVVADCTPSELWERSTERLREWGIDLPISMKMHQLCEMEGSSHVLTST